MSFAGVCIHDDAALRDELEHVRVEGAGLDVLFLVAVRLRGRDDLADAIEAGLKLLREDRDLARVVGVPNLRPESVAELDAVAKVIVEEPGGVELLVGDI